MKPLKMIKVFGSLTMLVWLIGTVIAGLATNFQARQDCIEREGWLKGSLSCSNASPLGFGANMLLGAGWPLTFVRSAIAQSESTVSKSVTQEEFDKSSVGVMYTCMAIAVGARNTEDANLLVATIENMRTKFAKVRQQHDDFMKLAARASANLESSGLSNQFYEVGCRKALTSMKQLTSRPAK